ncbi:MAG: hypothetical protein ACI4UK_01790, partial [Floccifex sp.]
MNEKYGEEFSVVSSKKEYEAGYAPTSIQSYWCDVEVNSKDLSQSDSFTVRVTLDENTENYIVQWDTYMTALVKPWLKEHMDTITNNIFNGEFFSICNRISGVNCEKGFAPDFSYVGNDSLTEVLYKYDIFGYYIIVIPEKLYEDNSTINLIYEKFNKELSGSSIKVEVRVYKDDFYGEYKNSFHNGTGIPYGYDQYEVINETISFIK